MFSVPDGRAANQPLRGDDLQAADWRVVARRARQLGGDRLAGQVDSLTASGDSFSSLAFCSGVAGASMRV